MSKLRKLFKIQRKANGGNELSVPPVFFGHTAFSQIEETSPELKANLRKIVENSIKHTNSLTPLLTPARLQSHAMQQMINVVIHILLWSGDLAVLFLAGLSSSHSQNVIARVVAAHLYEMSHNLVPQLLGGDFRKDLQSLPAGSGITPEYQQLHKKLMEFKREHGAALRRVRNTAIAHREKDVMHLCKEIGSLRDDKILPAAVVYLTMMGQLSTMLRDEIFKDDNIKLLKRRVDNYGG